MLTGSSDSFHLPRGYTVHADVLCGKLYAQGLCQSHNSSFAGAVIAGRLALASYISRDGRDENDGPLAARVRRRVLLVHLRRRQLRGVIRPKHVHVERACDRIWGSLQERLVHADPSCSDPRKNEKMSSVWGESFVDVQAMNCTEILHDLIETRFEHIEVGDIAPIWEGKLAQTSHVWVGYTRTYL